MRIYLLLCLFLMAYGLNAQVYYVNENFNNGSLPLNWTNSANTGINVWLFGLDGSSDHPGPQNLDGTNFVYFDDSDLGASSTNDNTSLETPSFDNSGSSTTTLEFDYNFRQFGTTVPDSFKVEVYDGSNWVLVFSRTTDDCGNYLTACLNIPHATVDISAYANTNCKVRFTYFDGNDWGWYVGLDNVEIYSPVANDLGVIAIESPKSSCGLGATESISVKVYNFGTLAQSNFSIAYQLNNGPIVTEQVNQSILPNDSLIYTFISTANLSMVGNYSIHSFTDLASDSVVNNDTVSVTITNALSAQPNIFESFETNQGNWTSYGSNNSWMRGMPSSSNVTSTPYGAFSFATNPSGNYNNQELSYIESPCLDFSSSTIAPRLVFYMNHITEPNFDKCWMEYSLDNGITWAKLNASPISQNWYSTTTGSAWSGNSNGWLRIENDLTTLASQSGCKLRFVFESDGSSVLDGVYIDNFSIITPITTDLSLTALVYPLTRDSSLCGFNLEPIVIEVRNNGLDTIRSFDGYYQVDNGPATVETFNVTIPPNGNQIISFSQLYNFSSVKTYNVRTWTNTIGDSYLFNDSTPDESIVNISVSSAAVRYRENFESFPASGLANGWSTNSGSYSWVVSNRTPSNGTGPAYDHTLGQVFPTGSFAFVEASFPASNGDVATLTTPCINFSNATQAKFSFWYHKYGISMGDLFIDVYDGVRWIENIDSIIGATHFSSSDPWLYREVDLNAYAGRKIKVRFRGVFGSGPTGDMAIDDLQFWEPLQQDAEMLSIEEISRCFSDTLADITVKMSNFGTQTIQNNTLSVSIQLNNGPITTEVFPGSILAGDTVIYQLNQKVITKQFPIDVRAWTNLANDSHALNDTIDHDEQIKDFDDFENDISPTSPVDTTYEGWYVEQNTIGFWEMLSGAHPFTFSGPNYDHTIGVAGNGNYLCTSGRDATVYSPCIDFTGGVNAKVSFWYHMFSSDPQNLFIDGSIDGVNWIALDSILGPVQQSKTDPWLKKEVSVTQATLLSQPMQLRFRSEVAINKFAVLALDDISTTVVRLQDLEMIDLLGTHSNSCFSASHPISVRVRNNGPSPIDFNADNIFINTSLIGPRPAVLRDTIKDNLANNGMPLLPGDTMTFPLSLVDLSVNGSYIAISVLSSPKDEDINNNATNSSFFVNNSRRGQILANNTAPCIGDTVILTLVNSNGSPQWERYNGQNWVSVSVNADTTFMVMVTGNELYRATTCAGTRISDTLSLTLDPNCSVGLHDINAQPLVQIYPNPTTGALNLTGIDSFEQIIVSNQLGQEVFNINVNGRSQTNIRLEGESGIYFIRLVSDHHHQVYKVVKY